METAYTLWFIVETSSPNNQIGSYYEFLEHAQKALALFPDGFEIREFSLTDTVSKHRDQDKNALSNDVHINTDGY